MQHRIRHIQTLATLPHVASAQWVGQQVQRGSGSVGGGGGGGQAKSTFCCTTFH